MPIGVFAISVLRSQLDRMLSHEAGTRLGEDPEELHDMRVAVRRLRAAIRLFRPVLKPGWKKVRDELAWFAEELGRVRDLDVLIGRIEGWLPKLGKSADSTLTLLEELRAIRKERRIQLLAALDSTRFEELIKSFRSNLPEVRTGEAQGAVQVKVPALIGRRARRFFDRARELTAESTGPDRHQVRILAKRFRYAVDFSIPVYGLRAERVSSTLGELQDILGAHQDAFVAKSFLETLADGRDSLEPALAAINRRFEASIRKDSKRELAILKVRLPEEWDLLTRKMGKLAKKRSPR